MDAAQPRRVTVITAYRASRDDPIIVRAGEHLQVGRSDAEWPGWRWCTAPDGRQSWVHEGLLSFDEMGHTAVVRRDYSAAELTVRPGDSLEVLEELGGWVLCRAADESVGWVPTDKTDVR